MGQGQSGQAGFPGQGPPGEKKDQVSPSGSACRQQNMYNPESHILKGYILIHRSKQAQGWSLAHTALLSLCVPVAEQGEEEVGASTASA